MRRALLLASLACLSAPLSAEPGLPDEAAVRAALEEHPDVAAARARALSARAEARARAKGTQEFTLSGSYVRRSVDYERTYDEFDSQLTRPIRLPGKAALDREIGNYGVEAAENSAEDVRHHAALGLAMDWWDWLGAEAEAQVDRQAVTNYETALAAVERRVALHDAAALEADQTKAALGAARIMAADSTGRARLARARLAAQFPGLPLPQTPPDVPQPTLPAGGLQPFRDKVISNSHEIAVAEYMAKQKASLAERTRRDKFADPSLGFRLFSERSGAERGAGLVFSIPIGGSHRSALADQAQADAGAAQADAVQARYDVLQTADTDLAEAEFRVEAWQRAREGLDAQMAALNKLRRGHELGEIDLSDRLLAERMVHEAFRAEAVARTQAVRAITKLRIDSHELWLAD